MAPSRGAKVRPASTARTALGSVVAEAAVLEGASASVGEAAVLEAASASAVGEAAVLEAASAASVGEAAVLEAAAASAVGEAAVAEGASAAVAEASVDEGDPGQFTGRIRQALGGSVGAAEEVAVGRGRLRGIGEWHGAGEDDGAGGLDGAEQGLEQVASGDLVHGWGLRANRSGRGIVDRRASAAIAASYFQDHFSRAV